MYKWTVVLQFDDTRDGNIPHAEILHVETETESRWDARGVATTMLKDAAHALLSSEEFTEEGSVPDDYMDIRPPMYASKDDIYQYDVVIHGVFPGHL